MTIFLPQFVFTGFPIHIIASNVLQWTFLKTFLVIKFSYWEIMKKMFMLMTQSVAL